MFPGDFLEPFIEVLILCWGGKIWPKPKNAPGIDPCPTWIDSKGQWPKMKNYMILKWSEPDRAQIQTIQNWNDMNWSNLKQSDPETKTDPIKNP